MTDIELLPLPEWALHPKHVAVDFYPSQLQAGLKAYARANVAHATAAKDAEIERLREDAERYRWLRGSHWYVGPEPDGDTEGVSLCDRNDGTLDAAIDAAREASNG